MLGFVAVSDKATLEGALSDGLTAVGVLITSAMVIWKYIQSRTEVKKTEGDVIIAQLRSNMEVATSQVKADATVAAARIETAGPTGDPNAFLQNPNR